MKIVEVSGRTLEEALDAAALELGVSKDDLEYELIEEGNKGFIGLGQTPTILKAWVAEKSPEEPDNIAEEEEASTAESVQDNEISTFAQAALDLLREVLLAMGLDATPALKSVESNYVNIDIVGTDLAMLIGKRGQTLDALQYLLQIAASKRTNQEARVILDAEGYRERHTKMLQKKASEYAEAVKEQQREAVLDPQSPRDRRVIHLALADHPDVYTYSEGFGDERHVVISPKR